MPLLTVEPFVYLCMTGFFLSIVSTPQLLLENRCNKYYSEEKCRAMYNGHYKQDYDAIQEDAAIWIAIYKVISNTVTFLALPTIGTLTDLFDRHRAMFVVPLSLLLRSSCMLLVLKDGKNFSTWILLLVGPIPGLVGGFGGLIVFATAYISDITQYEQRTLRITLIDAASVMAGFTATLISGFIIEKFGYFGIYTTVLGLVSLAILHWIFFIKPEAKHIDIISKKSRLPGIVSSHVFVDSAATFVLPSSESKMENFDKSRMIGRESSLNFALPSSRRQQKASRDMGNKHVLSVPEEGHELNKDDDGLDGRNKETLDIESYASETEEDLEEEISEVACGNNDVKETTQTGELAHNDDLEPNCEKLSEEVKIHVKKTQSMESSETFGSKGRSDTCEASRNVNEIKTAWKLKANMPGIKELEIFEHDRGKRKFTKKGFKEAANPFKNFARILRAVQGTENIKLQIALLVVMAMTTFSNIGELNLIVVFLRNEPFYLRPRNVGFLMAFQNGAMAIIGLMLFNMIFQRLCRIDDLVMILVSSTLSIVYFISMALARSITMLYLNQILHAICTLGIPATRAFLSKMSRPTTVGAIMGLVSMVETFSSVLACFAAPITYSKLAAISPGAVYYIFASFMLIATIIAAVLNILYPRNRRHRAISLEQEVINNDHISSSNANKDKEAVNEN